MNEKHESILTISQHLVRELISAGHIKTADETIATLGKFVVALQATYSVLEATPESDNAQNS